MSEEAGTTKVGRRGALGRLFALAVGAATGAAVLRPDVADATTGAMQFGATNDAGSTETKIQASNGSGSNTFLVFNNGVGGRALYVQSNTGPAAFFDQPGGGSANTVEILRFQGSGHTLDVLGNGTGSAINVHFEDPASSARAVNVSHSGTGAGVFVSLPNAASNAVGVHADVKGTGCAFSGDGGTKGRGAQFVSNLAQIRLLPGTLGSHPAQGWSGDLYVDKTKRLWFCKGGANWHQIA